MYELHHYGVPYLDVHDVLERRIVYKGFFVVSAEDEYILNLIPHLFYTGEIKEKYRSRQKELYDKSPQKIDNLLKEIFGDTRRWSQRRFFLEKTT